MVVVSRLILLPFGALLASVTLTGCIIFICNRNGWMVAPRPDRWHRKAVAQFGGIAILLSFALVGSFTHLQPRLLGLVLLTLAMGVVGLWDDIFPLPPAAKLGAQVLIACVTVSLGVVYPLRTANWVNIGFTVFWIVGITNALNLLDGMDGLAAGVGIIAATTLALLTSDGNLRLLSLIFIGAVAGFLIFNFKPAKIFMGDTGSLAIGYYLACSSILATEHISTVSSILFVPALVLFIPVFDTVLVSVTRRLNGRAISAGARDHTSNRLVLMGISEKKAVLVLYALAGLSGMVAILWKRMWPELGWGALGVFLLVATLFWLHMARLRLPEEYMSRTNVFTLVFPELLQSVVSKAGVLLLDMSVIALSLYLAFLLRFEHFAGVQLSAYLALCCIALVVKLPPLALFGAYRWHSSMSARAVYLLVKSAIVGSLAFVTAAVLWNRFDGLPRAVFGIDLLLTTLMLIAVRSSGWLFDHTLSPGSRPRCLLVNNAHSHPVNAYFDDPAAKHELAEIILTGSQQPGWSSELEKRVGRNHIQAIYCGPECSDAVRAHVARLAASHGLACYDIEFSVQEVSPHYALAIQPKPLHATKASGGRGH